MKYSHQQYAQALYEALHEVKPKDHDKVIDNFIVVLKGNGDLAEYEIIINTYEQLDRTEHGIQQVNISTAHEVEVNATILKHLNAVAGQDIEVKKKIDGNLIGGVVIKVEDTLIDGSVQGQLVDLKSTLTQ